MNRFFVLLVSSVVAGVGTLVRGQSLEAGPEFAWARAAGGASNDKTRCVTTDAQGNVFLAGEMTGEVKFGDIALKSAGGMDFFVAKLDATGKFLWARHGGGSLVDRGYGVATDAQGNCYVTGHCQSTDADFDGTKLGNKGDYDAFVAKYDREGKLLWLHQLGSSGYDYGHAIAVDGNGHVVVGGALAGKSISHETQTVKEGTSRTAGTASIPRPNATDGGQPFCAKYSADGAMLWLKAAEGNARGSAHGVGVDANGNIYLGGLTSGNGTFGSKPLVTPKGQSSLVAKLTPDGEVQWIAQNFGEPSCIVHELTADAQGRVWVSGMFKGKATFGSESFTTSGDKDSDAYIAHYDTEGKLQWVRAGQGPAVDYGLGVVADGDGGAFLTGEFTGAFKLAGALLNSHGATDVYVAKFDVKGTLKWLAQAGGDKGDNAYTMARDRSGALLIAGSFGGTAAFGGKSITSGGGNDLYVAKLAPGPK